MILNQDMTMPSTFCGGLVEQQVSILVPPCLRLFSPPDTEMRKGGRLVPRRH